MPSHSRQRQLSFDDPRLSSLRFFGGSYCTRRKFRVARPISTKRPMHFVLRSSQARGVRALNRPEFRKRIAALISNLGEKWGVEILSGANVGNHLHLFVRFRRRGTYKRFICALTGGIAAMVEASAVRKGFPRLKRFWDYRPFSRIVIGRRGFLIMRDYLLVNVLEGLRLRRVVAEQLVRHGRVVAGPEPP